MTMKRLLTTTLLALAAGTALAEYPDKPITINLNVKIEHEIRVKVDRELDDLFKEDKGLF